MRVSAVFSAASIKMQLEGQAAAQRKQATHFSSPFSSRWRTWAPRKRSWRTAPRVGPLPSGEFSTTVGWKISRKVMLMPLAMAAALRTIDMDLVYGSFCGGLEGGRGGQVTGG